MSKKRIPGTSISYRGQMGRIYKGITSRDCKRDVTKSIYDGMSTYKSETKN